MAGALCGGVDRGHPRCGRRVSRRVLRTSASGVLEMSDDTPMTLFTLEGQVRAARDGVPLIDAIRQSYLDRYRTQNGRWNARDRSQASRLVRHAVLWQRQAPGNTCLSALGAGGRGSLDVPINDSKGCGGVMRTAPIGFLGDELDDATCYVQGAAAAALTHGHADGYAPSGVMALAVRKLLDGASWMEAIVAGLPALQVHREATGTRQLLHEVGVALKSDDSRHMSASFGLGWVGDEALAVGLHAAATAGQLYGAKHGLAALPAKAVYRLDVLEPLLEGAGELAQAATLRRFSVRLR